MSKAEDFLVEVGTEELPPKALRKLMNAFASGIQEGLEKNRLGHGEIRAFASPRRLAVIVSALEDGQEDREVRRKGPPVSVAFDDKGQATKAALAFAKKCGAEVDDLEREKTDAGEWLSLTVREPGKSAACLVPGIVQNSLDALPIPRRMRWGAHAEEFVRPVHWLIMLHGATVIPGAVLGIESSNQTRGHRFHTSGELEIGSPADYVSTLESPGYVIADFAVRREKIVGLIADAAKKAGGEAVGDDSLYDEVTALTEWPVSLTGSFDDDFLALPREVIIATLTNHQRYFPVADKQGALLPVFITLANLESKEPDRVREGNERVIRPRLADAAFFWATDQQIALSGRTGALKNVVYQKGLGTLHDKSMRVAALARLLAEQLGVDGDSATRAAVLAKCDLLTGMVGEFPELQGTMGAYYARAGEEADTVATAIGEQYLPRFAGDALPASVDGQILALADKLDTLAGIFVLGKKPTGNRDPFGLRRAALGFIRILIEKNLELDVVDAINAAVVQQPASGEDHGSISGSLHEFIVERLKSYFLDGTTDYTADMFEAVRVRQPASLPDFQERLRAVVVFLGLEQSVSLAAANKRTANILRQAKFSESESTLDATLLIDDAEQVLFHAMQSAKKDIAPLIQNRAYSDSLRRLAELRAPVDSFFDDVMVMTDDEKTRNNRLALLAGLRDLFLGVADISRLTPAQE
jgi:glycyl-tRNA synthetase beta chain